MAILNLRAWNWKDLFAFLKALQNSVFANPNFRPNAAPASYDTDAFTFRINGRYFSKAAAAAVSIAAANHLNTIANQFRKARIEVDSAGAITFKAGAIAASQGAAEMPRRSKDKATIGWMQIDASFTAGTTALTGRVFNGDPDLSDGIGFAPSDRGIENEVPMGN